MTPEQINRIIVEKGEGGCWHDIAPVYGQDEWTIIAYYCKKENRRVHADENPDFRQWSEFGRLLKVARKCDGRTLDIINTQYVYGDIDQIPLLVATEVARILEERP